MNWWGENLQNLLMFLSEAWTESLLSRFIISMTAMLVLTLIIILVLEIGLRIPTKINRYLIRFYVAHSKRFRQQWLEHIEGYNRALSKVIYDGNYEEEIFRILTVSRDNLSPAKHTALAAGLQLVTTDEFQSMRLDAILKFVASSDDRVLPEILEQLVDELRSELNYFNEVSEAWDASDAEYAGAVLAIFRDKSFVKSDECASKLKEFRKLLEENSTIKPDDVVGHFLTV